MIGLLGKLKFYALAAAGFIAAAFVAYWQIRDDGKKAAELDQAKARNTLEGRYREVDGQNISVDDAYRDLRSGGMYDH